MRVTVRMKAVEISQRKMQTKVISTIAKGLVKAAVDSIKLNV